MNEAIHPIPHPIPQAQAPQAFEPKQPLTLTLEAQEWNIVLAGLQELPAKYSMALIDKVQKQLLSDDAREVRKARHGGE